MSALRQLSFLATNRNTFLILKTEGYPSVFLRLVINSPFHKTDLPLLSSADINWKIEDAVGHKLNPCHQRRLSVDFRATIREWLRAFD